MVILVICLVGLMTAYDYINLKSSIEHESSALQNQTEQSITAALQLTDKTDTIMDEQLNRQMMRGFDVLFAEYNRSGGNPAAMDLTKVKTTLGEGYDIYIINESGMIVYTTYPPELGQDFRQVPYFYEYLTKVRMSQGFFPDRVVHELLGNGVYRKYAYEATPDHQYVMEIGYSTPAFKETNQKIDDQNNIAKLVLANPYVDQFRIFDMMGHRADDASLPDNRTESYLMQGIASRQTLEINDPVNHHKIRYLFIDLKNPRYGSDLSRIVEITYDTGRVEAALNGLVFIHLLFGIWALLIGCALAYAFSHQMNRPIAKIAHDADIIASGDFEHRIGTTQAREFVILEKSINKMVDSLKDSAKTLKDEEIFHKDLINQMPVGIFLKKMDTGRYVFWNQANEEIFEQPATDVIGKSDEELFPATQAAQIKEEDAQALGSRLEIKCKKITTRTHGERVLHMIIVPIYDSKKSVRYILGITEDVTDEVSTLKKDLIFSITRSDILDQLAIIMSYLERAQLKTTQEDMQMFFDKTIGSVESIKNQIAYEGAFQTPGFIAPRWQSVNLAFNEATRMLPEHSVDIRVDVGNTEIFADPLLPRIFFGLLSQSFRRGGQTVSRIQMTAHRSGESLILVYEDDRDGIPTADKEQIFEFGYSHENIVSLFLIRELLSFTGITITETGEPEKGMRFEIVVPKGRFRPVK